MYTSCKFVLAVPIMKALSQSTTWPAAILNNSKCDLQNAQYVAHCEGRKVWGAKCGAHSEGAKYRAQNVGMQSMGRKVWGTKYGRANYRGAKWVTPFHAISYISLMTYRRIKNNGDLVWLSEQPLR